MKQMYMLFFGLLVLILTGCSDHDWADTNTDKPVKVTAQIAKSRVGFNEVDNITNAYWQEGDAITLFTSSQGNLDYVAGASAGSSSSKAFTPRNGYLKAIDGEQVLACYPASPIEDGKVSLPITTDWEDNDPMPFAYAVSSIEDSEVNLQFEHVFSFLKLTVTPSMLSDTTKAVRQLIVRTSSGAPLSIGEGSTFDYSTKEASIANGENTIQIATDTKVVRTSWEVYLPVLPQPADADITITLADEAGEILFELTKKTPSTGLEKGNVYRVGTSISYDTSFLIDGPTFNTRIKELANGGDFEYWMSDEKIGRIKFVTSESSLPETKVLVSADDSPAPVYASFSETDSLLTISTQAGDIKVENARNMFHSLRALHTIDFGVFDIDETTTSIAYMFDGCPALKTIETANWNTSNVTDMSFVFSGCSGLTSLDVSGWDTSKASYIEGVFSGCSGLTSLDVSGWNTTGVRSMAGVFFNCSGLTSLNVSSWDTSNVMDMSSMFNSCSDLTSLDLTKWNTANVDNMYGMFSECSSATELKVSGWDTSNVTDMGVMFKGCSDLTSLDFTKWNTANVDNMNGMFMECSSLEKLDLSGWNTVSVTGMGDMFRDCSSLIELGLSTTWNTTNVDVMERMFAGCSSLDSLDLSSWNTSNVIYMSGMFCDCSKLKKLDVSNWNTGKVQLLNDMFGGCSSLESLDLSSWDTSSATDMYGIFLDCTSLTNLNVSGWDTSNVTDMACVFYGCTELTSLDVSDWNTSSVRDLSEIFCDCSSLTSLDLSGWDTSNVTGMTMVFSGCSDLTQLNISNWSLNEETEYWEMFYHCAATSKNCRVTSSLATKEFLLARTDDTAMNPEWFTWDGSSYEDMPNQDW